MVRNECWNDLNAPAIERGADTPGRKLPCGFEVAVTIQACPRRRRYVINDEEPALVQLTLEAPARPNTASSEALDDLPLWMGEMDDVSSELSKAA